MVIAVLSITVLPKFSTRSALTEYALRDQLMSLIQQAQQFAMVDHSGACYRIVIQANGAEVQRNGIVMNAESRLLFTGDYSGFSATVVTAYFDPLGNVLTGGSDCATSINPNSAVSININGGNAIGLLIHPTGYIQRQG